MLNLWRLQLLRLPFPFSRFSLKHRTHGKRSDNPTKEKQIKIAMQPDLLPHKVSPQVKREMRQRTDEIFALAEDSENAAPLTPQELTPGEFMKHMNTSLEYFFYRRPYNLHNFNFYLQVLAKQHKHREADQTIDRMRALGIAPDHYSYVHWISAHARNKDAARVEQLIAEAEAEGITKSVEMLTGLILAFTKRADALNAEKVLREIEEAGMTPTVVSYTAVIDAYKKAKNYQKCWELFDRVHAAG